MPPTSQAKTTNRKTLRTKGLACRCRKFAHELSRRSSIRGSFGRRRVIRSSPIGSIPFWRRPPLNSGHSSSDPQRPSFSGFGPFRKVRIIHYLDRGILWKSVLAYPPCPHVITLPYAALRLGATEALGGERKLLKGSGCPYRTRPPGRDNCP